MGAVDDIHDHLSAAKGRMTDTMGHLRSKVDVLTHDDPSNWSVVDSAESGTRVRDVYQEQQLRRGSQPKVKTPFSRQVGSIAVAIALFVATWLILSVLRGAQAAAQLGDMAYMRDGRVIAYALSPTVAKVVMSLLIGGLSGGFLYLYLMRNLDAQNAMASTEDINPYTNDQHIALPEEVQRFFDWFPDAGMHSGTFPKALISHMHLTNDGVSKVDFVVRHAEGDDDEEFFACLDGDTEGLDVQRLPRFDYKLSDALFDTSSVPKEYWRRFDPSKIPYNPGNRNRDKLKGYDTVADLASREWELPAYEVERPAGGYVVDTAPVNTLVIAITRAGKGQTYIEPMIDMWTRMKHPQNIVVNDPKGELLLKFYVPAVVRGYRPVQFNLINALKTDIENPLCLAAQSARQGDATKVSTYVTNIGDVFFPVDASGQQDPMWNNAANNAFKREAFGIIEYTLEEEKELRARAERDHIGAGEVEVEVDRLWGHATLYNCYQMFVQMTSKKLKNPATVFNQHAKAGDYGNDPTAPEYQRLLKRANALAKFWNNQADIDLLTLYFNATAALPRNQMRTLVGNADDALRAMGGSEKTIASVYGIALTSLSFFSDPTIYTMTSGTPSQSVDLSSFSFPRCIGVRLHPGYLARYHLVGMQARWQAFADQGFTESLGKDFYHEDTVSREGWARFYCKGIFPESVAYLKLELVNPVTGVLIREMFFRFEKSWQRSLDGRHYVKDQVLDEKIVLGGILTELVQAKQRDGSVRHVAGHMRFPSRHAIVGDDGSVRVEDFHADAVRATMVRYEEKPKILFMVTPPHLMSYAKLVLIILKQLVDLNFDQSYMTNSSQKPDYATMFMLDELGNLQSEGHGIQGLETMCSIGLGQSQFFTLILQTLAQLRSVYGDDMAPILQGNAQPLNSHILTPNGWKTMGEMRPGTTVVTPRGTKAQVTGVFPRGERKVYRIVTADGRSCEACGQHLWVVRRKH